jgi:predicted ATPase
MAVMDLLFGLTGQAMEWQKRTAERLMSNSHPYSKAFGMIVSSFVSALWHDPTTVSEFMVPARQICDEYGFPEVSGVVKQFGGWANFRRGERVLGMAQMREAIEELRALGSLNMSTWRLVLLAEMQLEAGDIHAAEATVAEAFENLERTRERWCEPEVYRIGAEVLLRKPDPDPGAAEVRLRRAIEIAQGQGTKWWELRATVSLARLLAKQGRRDNSASRSAARRSISSQLVKS